MILRLDKLEMLLILEEENKMLLIEGLKGLFPLPNPLPNPTPNPTIFPIKII